VLLLALPGAEPNEAEKLFRQMETKVMKAKAVECAFDSKIEVDPGGGTAKGTLHLSDGNKMRLVINAVQDGEKVTITTVSDGMKWKTITVPGGEEKATDVKKSLNDVVRATISRSGLTLAVLARPPADNVKEFKVDEEFKVSDFKLGKKDKIGDKEAQIIEYTLKVNPSKVEPVTVTLWLDSKTQLPLKRVFKMKLDNKEGTVTETFSKLDLEAKIDANQFELPKK
jgi:outer membrane lipoprotein-sorting protein